MANISQEPYLWVHVAGLALVPVLCDVLLVGLAMGEPLGPAWLELGLIATLGGLPVLWMQWARPFYIFSLGPIALVPTALTEQQQRLLTRFKTPLVRGLVTVAFGVAIGLLVGLYSVAPVILVPAFLATLPRLVGLLIALVGFWGCNLFIQIPLSAIGVLLTQPSQLTRANPYPISKIEQDFTLVGLQLDRLLPRVANVAQRPIATTGLGTLHEPLGVPPNVNDTRSDLTQDPMSRSDISASAALDKSPIYEEEYDLDDPWS